MHFAFTEDQIAITEAVRTMLAETCTPADLRKLIESGQPRDDARWSRQRGRQDKGVIKTKGSGLEY